MAYLTDAWGSTTQRIVLAFGVWFTVGNYVAGTVIWPQTIADPWSMHMTRLLGFIPVMINGWHLYFHLVTGLICLALASRHSRAVKAAWFVGALYVVTGVVGLAYRGDIYGFIMADTFGNWVHIAEGTGLLATALGARISRGSTVAV